MKRLFTLFVLVQIFSAVSYAQGPGEPFHPETANGARYINWEGHTLKWKNPLDVICNKVYFSADINEVVNLSSSALIYNGFPNTVYTEAILLESQLESWKRYYWRIVQYYDTGVVAGPVWSFLTRMGHEYDTYTYDFSNDIDPWIITNDGGDCIWQVRNNTSYYTLPIPFFSSLLAADSYFCGQGTTLFSSATTFVPFEVLYLGHPVSMTWANDWRHYDSTSAAYVEFSTDNGATWEIAWQKVGESRRNTVEQTSFAITNEFYLRFRSVQPGRHWWWAISNIKIFADYAIHTFIFPPKNIILTENFDNKPKVTLSWQHGTNDPIFFPSFYRIERKQGLPNSPSQYQLIVQVPYNNLTYSDTNIILHTDYTYRIKSYSPHVGGYYGPEVTAYFTPVIPVELYSFTAEIFNNDVILNWSTATETNNSGFEIQRASFRLNETTPLQEWETIGFVPGNGTTNEHQFYSFADKNLNPGSYLFRLKQIDFDGSFEYSNNIEVNITSPSVYALEQNFPNPFNPVTKIKYSIPAVVDEYIRPLHNVTLIVYDVLGNKVATLVNEPKVPGIYEAEWNAEGFSSGVYFYRLQSGEFSSVKKLILMK